MDICSTVQARCEGGELATVLPQTHCPQVRARKKIRAHLIALCAPNYAGNFRLPSHVA